MLLIIGDIHGDFSLLRARIQEAIMKHPEITAVIQVGDFGYYPYDIEKLETMTFQRPIYWVDGNHELFGGFVLRNDDPENRKIYPSLVNLTKVTEITPSVFYVPRGTVLELDGKKIAFLGGAASVDKQFRLRYNMDWSPSENIAPHELLGLVDVESVDLMITHCPPQSVIQKHFDPRILVEQFNLPITWRDPNADIVEKVWEKFGKPPLFCGHMHRSVTDGNCRILHLNEIAYF